MGKGHPSVEHIHIPSSRETKQNFNLAVVPFSLQAGHEASFPKRNVVTEALIESDIIGGDDWPLFDGGRSSGRGAELGVDGRDD